MTMTVLGMATDEPLKEAAKEATQLSSFTWVTTPLSDNYDLVQLLCHSQGHPSEIAPLVHLGVILLSSLLLSRHHSFILQTHGTVYSRLQHRPNIDGDSVERSRGT
jgi:hypothetical protein